MHSAILLNVVYKKNGNYTFPMDVTEKCNAKPSYLYAKLERESILAPICSALIVVFPISIKEKKRYRIKSRCCFILICIKFKVLSSCAIKKKESPKD